MPRSRTQKQVARRINIFYFREGSPMRKVRRMLIAGCALLAVLWIGISAVRSTGAGHSFLDRVSFTSLHNPGHVAPAHASFENDCAKCHVGEKPGQYTSKVTDTACLTCHDGAIHRENQARAANATEVSMTNRKVAIEDPNHRFKLRSAGCIECHTEHRGEAELVGRNDKNCTICHDGLRGTNGGKPAASQPSLIAASVMDKITAFAVDKHPHFGRSLEQTVEGKSKWVDPTKLKFDHKFHFGQFASKNVRDPAQTCVFCHTTGTESRLELSDDDKSKLPPFDTGKQSIVSRNGDNGYMMPVTYAQHCSVCHPMEVAGMKVPHVALPDAIKSMSALADNNLAKLAVMSDDDRKKALTPVAAGGSSAPKSGGGRGRRPAATETPTVPAGPVTLMTPNAWLKLQLKWVKGTAGWLDDSKLDDAVKEAIKKDIAADAPPSDALIGVYLAFAMDNNSCGKCHDVDLKKDGDAISLTTLPTEIPSTPRHWFGNSRFDHRPHRGMGCVDCHGAALDSGDEAMLTNIQPARETSTAQILSPDMHDSHVSEKNQCVTCHNPNLSSGSTEVATMTSCISCHVFHDRSKERPAPATQPIAMTSETPPGEPAPVK